MRAWTPSADITEAIQRVLVPRRRGEESNLDLIRVGERGNGEEAEKCNEARNLPNEEVIFHVRPNLSPEILR